jgi:putative ABC transport system permease protein
LIAALTLAVGIGANTAIFSVVNAVLLSPLPYAEPERLTLIWTSAESIGLKQNWVSEPEVLDFREQSKLFEGFGVINAPGFRLTGNGEPEQLNGARISTNLFSLLGVRIKIGRDFAPDEEKPGAARVAILSHGLWQRRFGGEMSVVGSTISLNGNPTIVVGVLPAHFALMLPAEAHVPADLNVWIPHAVDYAKQERHSHGMTVIGRLKHGITVAQAQEEMNAIAARLYPLHYTWSGFGVKVVSMQGDIVKRMRPSLLVLLGATAAQGLLGRDFRVSQQRGQFIERPGLPLMMATVHPSSILRAGSDEERKAAMEDFVKDLEKVAKKVVAA